MTSLIIDATRMEVTGKFDSRRRFLRVTSAFRDAYFSRGETFNFNWGDLTGGQFIAYRYRNGPIEAFVQLTGSGYFPPAIADTSVGVTF